MLTCYIIDDEKLSIDNLIKEIDKIPDLELIGFNTNPLIALNEIQKGEKPDIIFLDVEMPELSGLELAKLLPDTTAVIIRSSYTKYAKNAYDINAVDFLFKPYNFNRFVQAIKKAQDYLQKFNSRHQAIDFKSVFITSSTKGTINQITISEIFYIEAVDHTISIHTKEQIYSTRMSLKDIEDKLKLPFLRVHRGFMINIDFIKSFDSNGITLINDIFIPLGEIYKQSFRDVIKFKIIN